MWVHITLLEIILDAHLPEQSAELVEDQVCTIGRPAFHNRDCTVLRAQEFDHLNDRTHQAGQHTGDLCQIESEEVLDLILVHAVCPCQVQFLVTTAHFILAWAVHAPKSCVTEIIDRIHDIVEQFWVLDFRAGIDGDRRGIIVRIRERFVRIERQAFCNFGHGRTSIGNWIGLVSCSFIHGLVVHMTWLLFPMLRSILKLFKLCCRQKACLP